MRPTAPIFLGHPASLRRHRERQNASATGRVWKLNTRFSDKNIHKADILARAVRSLGVGLGHNNATGGSDIDALREMGVPVLDLVQDGYEFFDFSQKSFCFTACKLFIL